MGKKPNSVYTKNHEQLITKNIQGIIQNAREKQLMLLEPTLNEFKEVMNHILEYIRKEKRIIYGGYSLELLIGGIYTKEETFDIEFYSPDPMSDIKNICDSLHTLGFKNVLCEESIHKNTFGVFVNYLHYVDITYISLNIYKNIPTHKVQNLVIPTKRFLLIDFLRVINDPLTSYWRLDKTVPRYFRLIKGIQFISSVNEKRFVIKDEMDKETKQIYEMLYKSLILDGNYILFGNSAINVYREYATRQKWVSPQYLEFISENIKEDVKKVVKILEGREYKIRVCYYTPFSDLVSERCIIFVNNVKLVHILSNNNMCIPYITFKKLKIVSFGYLIQLSLVFEIYYKIYNNVYESNKMKYYITQLFQMRDAFYKKNVKLTPLSDTLFKEFIIDCKGETVSPIRKFKLLINKRFKKQIRTRFRYAPDVENKSKLSYEFRTEDGSIYKCKNIKN